MTASKFVTDTQVRPAPPTRAHRVGLRTHARRVLILAIMYAFNRAVLWMIGRLNAWFGFLSTVFVMYPATEAYALRMVYPRWLHSRQ